MAPNNVLTKARSNKTWQRLVGDASMFSLECRVFHSISLGTILASAVYATYYNFIGFYVPSISCLLVCLFFIFQYYFSRFKGKAFGSVAFGITIMAVFTCNYFYNAGIDGATDLLMPIYLMLALALFPRRQHIIWLVVIFLHFLLLHLTEYYYPALVHHPFKGKAARLLDRISAFPMELAMIYIIISYLRRNYDNERRRTQEKTRAIEQQNEQILLQKKQLEQSNAEKSKLMSIISHDLRAPIVAIQSYLELITEKGVAINDREIFERSLLATTRHTLGLLSNLLLWSKSQMGGSVVTLANINLHQALESTLALDKILAVKKGIALNCQVNPGIQVMADSNMLQLVVRNLVGNAIKFTPSGGTVEIVAQPLGNECRITVKDNGRGIEEAKQSKVFSIQAESTFGTDKEKGVGLGLHLCKEFIERQGGRIGFESTAGVGSSFYIFIPAAPTPL